MFTHDLLVEKSAGILQLGEVRMALLDIEAGFWGIRRQMEALIGNGLTNSVLQQAGTNGGASFARSFIPNLDQPDAAAFSACLEVYQSAGFGQFEITTLDWPIGRIGIRANQAFEAWMMAQNNQSTNTPCCAYTAGVLVGFVNVIGERQDVVCIERSCQGKGDEFCQFDLLPAEEARDQSVVSFSPDPGLGRQVNLLEMLFERMPMGIAIFDREYRIQRYNTTWGEFSILYSPPEGAPLAPGVYYFDHLPGSEQSVIPLFERVMAGETIRADALRFESGGIVSYWDVVLAPLVEDGDINGILNVTTDATERVQLQQNLEGRVEERTRELDRRRKISDSLREIIGMINSDMPLETLLDRAVEMAVHRLGAAACILHNFDIDNKLITHLSSYGMEGIFEKSGVRHFSELKASGDDNYLQATLQRQPTYTNYPPIHESLDEIRSDPTIPESIKTARIALRERFAGSFSVPLFIQDKVYGGMVFYYNEPQDFSDKQIHLGMTFAEQVALAIENARAHQAEQDRQRELQMLLDVAATANSSLDLDETIANTLDLVVALVGASRAGVIILDEQTGRLTPHSLRPEQAIEPNDLAKIIQVCQAVITNNETLYVAPDIDKNLFEPGALIPLQIRSKILGVLVIIGSQGGEFNQEQLVLFKSIADQLGVAMENARLYENTEDAAIAAERNRLARDLHDAVSQTLFSASLIAEVLPRIWERDPEEGQRRLKELRELTRGALAEMRTLLLELRPAALIDAALDDLLRQLAESITSRARVPVTMEVEGKCVLSPEVKVALYRIAQEALNNVAKHAEASQTVVSLYCGSERVELCISDDGGGFDPQDIPPESLGLGIMRDRVKDIGAALEIDSKVGHGTQIVVVWGDKGVEELL
ncbi:MAG: GAF domain-containing protein [Chloroflexota bacterium]|nr:GAF domain-containing protein [Chloroflexota bacterium]